MLDKESSDEAFALENTLLVEESFEKDVVAKTGLIDDSVILGNVFNNEVMVKDNKTEAAVVDTNKNLDKLEA